MVAVAASAVEHTFAQVELLISVHVVFSVWVVEAVALRILPLVPLLQVPTTLVQAAALLLLWVYSYSQVVGLSFLAQGLLVRCVNRLVWLSSRE